MYAGKKISVLHDNPDLPGKKFFLASIISPESRQKHDVYAMKFHDVSGEYEEAMALAEYYKNLDPDFDVFVGTMGKWCPWLFNFDEVDAVYSDKMLTELVANHRKNAKVSEKQFFDRVTAHANNELPARVTREFKEKELEKENAVQLLYRIRQLELVVKRRQTELLSIQEIFDSGKYTDDEREGARKLEDKFPLSEPAVMRYDDENIKRYDEGLEEDKVVVVAGSSSSSS